MGKLSLDSQVILDAYKDLGPEDFTLVMVASAYYTKYSQHRMPTKFTEELHPVSYRYFNSNIKPILDGKPVNEITVEQQHQLRGYIKNTMLFDDDEKTILNDMLDLWWGRGTYARTDMIYTQSMCYSRTKVKSEHLVNLRYYLKNEGCLTWENREFNGNPTSYHRFDEAKLYNLLKSDAED